MPEAITSFGWSGQWKDADAQTLRKALIDAEAELEDYKARLDGVEWFASKEAELRDERDGRLDAEEKIHNLQSRFEVRLVRRIKRLLHKGQDGLFLPVDQDAPRFPLTTYPEDPRYPTWIKIFDTIDDEVRADIRLALEALSARPKFSVILPVFDTPENYLREAIDSIRAQIYENWELCIADDASNAPWVEKVLKDYAALDPRISFVRREENGHISAASNTAISMAGGDWIALFDHDDLMAEHALALAAIYLDRCQSAGLLYSDEDHFHDDASRSRPYFKPDFDPLLLLGQNYLSHLCMIRRDLVNQVGGFRVGYEGSQDWDLVLRVIELLKPDQIVHVPHILYHWRVHPGSTSSSVSAKPYAVTAARKAVGEHLTRIGVSAEVLTGGTSGFNRVRFSLPENPPLVSIIVLPRLGGTMLRLIDSIRVLTTYPNIELVTVDDGSYRPPLRRIRSDMAEGIKVVEDHRGVSDGALRNAAAKEASGEILCFCHDDVEVISDSWLDELVGLVSYPGIGAVGAKLFYSDYTVQHAGIVLGIGKAMGYVHRGNGRVEPGYFGRALLAQCFSAVSDAAMVVKREAFEAVLGFDESHLSGAFCDADFCLRLGEAGWRIGWSPHAVLFHHEASDSLKVGEGENLVRLAPEIRYMRSRWNKVMDHDPAYNPNLSLAHETWPLAWPPRVRYSKKRAKPKNAES